MVKIYKNPTTNELFYLNTTVKQPTLKILPSNFTTQFIPNRKFNPGIGSLVDGLRTREENDPFKRKICKICRKSCNNLPMHMDKYHNKKEFCEICTQPFENLEKHVQKFHQKGGRKICKLCGKSCNNLQMHIDRFHTGRRKVCEAECV